EQSNCLGNMDTTNHDGEMVRHKSVLRQKGQHKMIQELRLHNFRCFADQTVSFKALTLFTGLNSTGKSSVLQSLLLLRQLYQQMSHSDREFLFANEPIHGETGEDTSYEERGEDVTAFQLRSRNG